MGCLKTALGTALLVSALAPGWVACGDDSTEGDANAPTRTAAEPETRQPLPPPPPPEPEAEDTEPPVEGLPAELVGLWIAQSGEAELAYEFGADGTYGYAGVLLQERPSGTFSVTISAGGQAKVSGSTLELDPSEVTREIKDPDVPSRNSTDELVPRTERFKWSIDASGDRLDLTDSAGETTSYDRQ